MLLLEAPSFANNTGLTIQISTKGRHGYSFIDRAAVAIGTNLSNRTKDSTKEKEVEDKDEEDLDVLEVSGFGQYMLGAVSNAELPAKIANKYLVSHQQTNDNTHVFTIDLGGQQALRLTTFKDWVNVALNGATKMDFGDSVGLMGSFEDGAMVLKDGETVVDDPNTFGLEWQLLDNESSLFLSAHNHDEQEHGCIMPDPTKAEKTRRLGGSLSQEVIEEACKHLESTELRKLCEYDVMVTGDIQVAQAGGF